MKEGIQFMPTKYFVILGLSNFFILYYTSQFWSKLKCIDKLNL